jgi:hypothetical protein
MKLSRIFLPSKQPLEPIVKESLPRFPFTLHLGLSILAALCVLTGNFCSQPDFFHRHATWRGLCLGLWKPVLFQCIKPA